MIAATRTALVAFLVSVVALRWSVRQPSSSITERIAEDPAAAVAGAGSAWTSAGTLGSSSVQAVRELPYALAVRWSTDAGLSAHTVEAMWRVLVLVLAVVGAVRLARGLSRSVVTGDGDEVHEDHDGTSGPLGPESWAPWAGALLYVLGAVLIPTVVRSPTDGLAAAVLPWVVAPLLLRGMGWRPVLASAVWLGVAGLGSPGWGFAALASGLVAALPRSRAEIVGSARWVVLALTASAWWLLMVVWEVRHTVDISALTEGGLIDAVRAATGRPGLAAAAVTVLVALPLVVCAVALVMRSPHLDRRFVVVLLGLVGGVAVLGSATGWPFVVPASMAGGQPVGIAGALLGCLALCGLVAWCPLVSDLVTRLGSTRGRSGSWDRRSLLALSVAVLVAATAVTAAAVAAREPAPAEPGDLELREAVSAWSSAADPGRVLLLPTAADSDSAVADLGPALGDRPWVGRDRVPSSGVAATTALDHLLWRLHRGDGGPGTQRALSRLGVSYVLVGLGGPLPVDRARPTGLVRAALTSVGAQRTTVLRADGADAAAAVPDPLVDAGVRTTTPQVEVWALPGAAEAWVYDGAPVEVVGDPGTVGDLGDADVLGARAVVVRAASDEESEVLSDSARRRDLDQRVPVDPWGPDLGSDEPRSVVPVGAAPVVTASRTLQGAVSVTASSSAAELGGGAREAGTDATSAIDANGFTAWQARRGSGVGEWWELELATPRALAGTAVQLRRNTFTGLAVSRVQVSIDGRTESYRVPESGLVELGDDVGTATRLRITVEGTTAPVGSGDSVGIVEVTVPGLEIGHGLEVVGTPTRSWLLAARLGSRTRCVPAVPRGPDEDLDPPTACNPGLYVSGADAGGLDRTITLDGPTEVVGRTWLVSAATEDAGALADEIADPSVVATGTSTVVTDLVSRPQAAADADRLTAWRADPRDDAPGLSLTWARPTEIAGVRLLPPDGDLGARPTRVRVAVEPLTRGAGTAPPSLDLEVIVGEDGLVPLPRTTTRGLTITVLEDDGLVSAESASGTATAVPVAVGEVEVVGGPAVTYDGARLSRLRCDDGPTVTIDGVERATRLQVTPDQIVSATPVRATLCDPLLLSEGEHRVTTVPTLLWQSRGVLLATVGSEVGDEVGEVAEPGLATSTTGDGPAPVQADVLGGLGSDDEVRLALGDADAERTLAVAVPAGTGWTATADGTQLPAVVVDGWAQGWELPAGSGEVELRHEPGAEVAPVLWSSLGWMAVVVLLVGTVAAPVVSRARRSRSGR